MKLVVYCRVSTDDKGQDPRRQEEVVRAWAQRMGHEVCAVVLDEGTSGSITPFQRQYVLEAVDQAKALGVDAIAVESVDRWTRGGIEDFFASSFALRVNHELQLLTAATPPGMSPEMVALFHAMLAAGAREYRENMNRQIRAGIERARRLGWPKGRPGRPAKAALTPAERAAVIAALDAGKGLDIIALELSHMRGAYSVADVKSQQAKAIKPTWLWAKIHSEIPEAAERLSARRAKYAPRKQQVAEPGAQA